MDLKNIKKEARKNIKNGYFKSLLVVFICTLLISGGINYSTKNILNVDITKIEGITAVNSYNSKVNSEILDELLEKTIRSKEAIPSKSNKGVLPVIINEIANTKSILFSLLNSINNFLGGNISVVIIILTANFILIILRTIFIQVLEIGKARYFLEQRRYLKTNIDKLLYPYKEKKNFRLAVILLCKNLYLFLWGFTIIGFFIKSYEYSMIPYILAENPKIKRKEAFQISKELMKGNKFNLFKLDISIIGWKILGLITFNILNIFFTNIYEETIHCEFYAIIREEKIENLLHKDLLMDKDLYVAEKLQKAYPEEIHKKKSILNIDYNKKYSINSYILFFFTFSFIGWSWEVILHIVRDGIFVNRGTMYGPWLPIYGYGGVAILILLKKFRKSHTQMFFASILLCAIIEYFGAWYLETFKHLKYWDYTGYFLNLHGRICLEALITFGLGGCAFTYILAPVLDNIYKKINTNIKNTICAILITIFVIDLLYISLIKPHTGEGITTKVALSNEHILQFDFRYKNS